MKTVLLAFFLLFAFSTTSADFVYDTDVEPLVIGNHYFIKPVFKGRGGGLDGAETGNETSCKLTIVQAPTDFNPGLPAAFYSPILSSSTIDIPNVEEGMPFSVSFAELSLCVPKGAEWVVVEEFPVGWLVKVAYAKSSLGTFKVEKYDKSGQHHYKIFYCPNCGDVCGDPGINHTRLVVRDGNPLIVQFNKANL